MTPTDASLWDGTLNEYLVSEVSNHIQFSDFHDPDRGRSEWFPIRSITMAPAYEQDQVALFCCRETVSLQTLSWVMSDDEWIEVLPQMMQRSESLKAVVHANAANYIAKAAGAKTTPRQALTHYSYALKELQTDLYDPVRQKSDETLFAIIILAIFDVDLVFSC